YNLDLDLLRDRAQDDKTRQTRLKEKERVVLDMDAAGQTDRLRKFVDLITRKRIAPFTKYAEQSNKEFYAEAYSLWLVDREFLHDNYLDIFNFFESGDYRH